MTENERIKKHIEDCEHRICNILGFMESNSDANTSSCEENISVLKTAIIALEEIQQYRAIGTVEEIQSMKDNGAFSAMELAQIASMQIKLKEYQSIGTIEELKALKEKSLAKKAIVYGHNDVVGTDVGLCPVCNDRPLRACDNQYCPDCGQKLDWSE